MQTASFRLGADKELAVGRQVSSTGSTSSVPHLTPQVRVALRLEESGRRPTPKTNVLGCGEHILSSRAVRSKSVSKNRINHTDLHGLCPIGKDTMIQFPTAVVSTPVMSK